MLLQLLVIYIMIYQAENSRDRPTDTPYCISHTCIPYIPLEAPHLPNILKRRLYDIDWATAGYVRRDRPTILRNFARLASFLDLANQTAPKLLRYSSTKMDKIEVMVYRPPQHKIVVPPGMVVTFSSYMPNIVYVWKFKTREVSPISPSIATEVATMKRILTVGGISYNENMYMIAFYDNIPFQNDYKFSEIWIPE